MDAQIQPGAIEVVGVAGDVANGQVVCHRHHLSNGNKANIVVSPCQWIIKGVRNYASAN